MLVLVLQGKLSGHIHTTARLHMLVAFATGAQRENERIMEEHNDVPAGPAPLERNEWPSTSMLIAFTTRAQAVPGCKSYQHQKWSL